MNTQKKKADEATIKRLAEARLKGLETRRMKAELKKVEKAEEKEALKKTYEEKVLKKTAPKKAEKVEKAEESTDKEIYANQPTATESDGGSDSEMESEPVAKPKVRKPTTKPSKSVEETPINYKQMYYQAKLERMRMQEEQANFMSNYARASPQTHMVDIAKSQLQSKVNRELMSRVYNDLFS